VARIGSFSATSAALHWRRAPEGRPLQKGGRERDAAARRNRKKFRRACRVKLLSFLKGGRSSASAAKKTLNGRTLVLGSAATNRELGAEIKKGAFREELFYRSNVVTIELPACETAGETSPCLESSSCAATRGERQRRSTRSPNDALEDTDSNTNGPAKCGSGERGRARCRVVRLGPAPAREEALLPTAVSLQEQREVRHPSGLPPSKTSSICDSQDARRHEEGRRTVGAATCSGLGPPRSVQSIATSTPTGPEEAADASPTEGKRDRSRGPRDGLEKVVRKPFTGGGRVEAVRKCRFDC